MITSSLPHEDTCHVNLQQQICNHHEGFKRITELRERAEHVITEHRRGSHPSSSVVSDSCEVTTDRQRDSLACCAMLRRFVADLPPRRSGFAPG
jgi:hypothetical protein